MDRIRYVTHREQRILLVDAANCSAEEVAMISSQVPAVVTQEPHDSVLLLADFSNSGFSKHSIEEIKVAAVFDKPHIKRAAWVLTDNLPKTLFDSIRTFSGRKIPVFASREEAMDYLVR